MEDRLNDPRLFALPHPVRFDRVMNSPVEHWLFEQTGVLEGLRPYLADPSATSEWIINKVPGMLDLAAEHFGIFAGQNMGTFMLMLARARLRAHGDPILKVAPELQSMLAETDLAKGLPVRFLTAPYPLVYVEFARPNPLRVPNQQSGLHECEGAYVGIYQVHPHHELFCRPERVRALKLDPAKPARAIEIILTGSPVGKRNALDDASQDLVLLVQDEDECLSNVLERHLAYFNTPEAYSHPGLASINPEEIAMVRPMVEELAKALLYLNVADAEMVPERELRDLEQRIKGMGPKKAARLKRQLETAYDRILIGPRVTAEHESQEEGRADAAMRQLRPHWRRGHFKRIRYGEGLSESRVGWIKPVLVNGAGMLGVKAKTYVVR